MRRPAAIDCFAGAGGLSLGLAMAGFRVASAFDADAQAVATYVKNLGDHARIARAEDVDVRTLLHDAKLAVGECALVAGGPPCQGFSVQRRGDDADVRNDLIFEFYRIVHEVQPLLFLMENVSALGGRRGAPHLEELIVRARRDGYQVQTRVLDAADFGVPQHRRRLFVVGERTGTAPRFAFPEPTHGLGRYVTVRDAIFDLPAPRPVGKGEPCPIQNHEPDNISALNRERIAHVPQGGGREHIPPELRLPCHRVSVDKAGHRNVYGRLHWDAPAGTITTRCNSFTRGKFAHPRDDRNISMREAARLQSFPDSFTFLGDKVATAHQIGNAVPPLLAMSLGRSLLEVLRKS